MVALFAVGAGGASEHPLPDLDQVVPRQLRVVDSDGRWLLGFASAVDNVGSRPLVIEGRRANRSAPMRVWQLVGARRYRVGGVLRFVTSEDHAHWHLLRFESYELRTRDGRPLGRDEKTGFCLTDSLDSGRETLPGEPRRAVWINECGRRRPDLLRVRAGISVGFRDLYEPFVEGQHVEITRLPAGRYVLVHRANPERILREAGYANNAASVLIRIRWPGGFGARPAVRVLARCPDSARCPT